LVTIVGSDFAVYRDYEATDLVFSGFGDLTSAFDGCFLFGSLSGGAPNNWIELNIQDNGQVSLVPVPGATLLGAIGLGFAGMRLRRKQTL